MQLRYFGIKRGKKTLRTLKLIYECFFKKKKLQFIDLILSDIKIQNFHVKCQLIRITKKKNPTSLKLYQNE